MAMARTAATSLRAAANGLARVCDLTAHPVVTSISRSPDARLVIVEQLPNLGRLTLARDAAILPRLQHPNLGRVRRVIPSPMGVEIVSDYVEGESLAELERLACAARSPIPLEVKLRILVDLLNGLSALHGHRGENGQPAGLVHRYVSPTNVIVGLDGATRLVHLLLPTTRTDRSEDPHRAPELATGASDARADLFAVGVLLDHALRAATDGEKAWADPFAEVVKRATQADPSARFATAAEMAAEVRKIAKAKLATPMIVAAAVDEIASEHIEERSARLAVQAVPAPEASGTARVGSFPEEAPTVPRTPSPELLQSKPKPPAAPPPANPRPSLPSPRKDLPPPPPKAPVSAETRSLPAPALDVPPPPLAILAAGPELPPLAAFSAPAPALAVPGVAVPLGSPPPMASEASDAGVEIELEDAPPVDFVLLPFAPSQTPSTPFQVGNQRRKRIVFGVLGVAMAILLIAAVRAIVERPEAPVVAQESRASSEATAAALPAPKAPELAPEIVPPQPAAEPTRVLPETNPPSARKIPAPPDPQPRQAASPPPQPASTASSSGKQRRAPNAPARPAATYDPLGI
jgi:eukaryotic-like serine/threonine-protein kinase